MSFKPPPNDYAVMVRLFKSLGFEYSNAHEMANRFFSKDYLLIDELTREMSISAKPFG